MDMTGPAVTGLGRAAAGWLAKLDLPAVSREIITDCLAFTGTLAGTIDQLDAQVRAHAKADPRGKTLTTLPRVGQFTTLVMLAEIGSIARFGSTEAQNRSGRQDLGLLAIELLSGDDSPVAQVGQLGQLVRCAGR
jgi:transposase